MAAAALVFAGCDKEPKNKPVVTTDPDKIELDKSSEKLDHNGGEVMVGVSCSSETATTWELTGGAEWATPSATSGKNGDFVKFVVDANETENELEAVYTFAFGDASATFKIVVTPKGEDPTILFALVEPQNGKSNLSNAAGRLEIKIDADESIDYTDIGKSVQIVSGADGWLSSGVAVEGDEYISVFFDYTANTSFNVREAVITIASDKTNAPKATLTVDVTQAQTNRLAAEKNSYMVEEAGGSVVVKLFTNVEYTSTIDVLGAGWLSLTKTEANNTEDGFDLTFTAVALPSPQPTRTAAVTFSYNGMDDVVVRITQRSSTALISTAAQMNKNWAWVPTWNNNAPLTNLSNYTFEALVNANNFTKTIATHGSASKLSTIGGIEGGKFMLRFGDDPIQTDQLQVIYPNGTNDGDKKTSNTRYATGEWLHLAVVFQSSTTPRFGKVYVNGVEQTEMAAATPTQARTTNFGEAINGNEQGWNYPRRFWIGYSWDNARFFDGMISEVRIWNRALTEEEINEPNHFYTVEYDADGLVAYWKFDDNSTGTSGAINDYSVYGNDLTTNIQVDWQSVSLP